MHTSTARVSRWIRAGSLCLAAAAALAASAGAAAAQGTPLALPTLESLKPASSPAFILLDAAPAQVSRPNDPADIAAALVSGTRTFSELPRDFAIEFSPYWLRSRPTLSWRSDLRRSMAQSVARTFTISAGSAAIGDSAQARTGLAIGGRALLLSGRVSPGVVERLAAREQELAGFSARIQALLDSVQRANDLERPEILRRVLGNTPPERRGVVADSLARVFQRQQEAQNARVLASQSFAGIYAEMNALEKAAVVREGPMLELAAGAAWGFDDDTWDTGRLHRAGVWLTYSCERCRFLNNAPAQVTPMLVARYLVDADSADTGLFDAGGRMALTGPRITGSVEAIRRTRLGSGGGGDLWRVVGTLEYEMQGDTWLVASFGRDSNSAPGRSLVARFGLKLNLVRDRYTEPAP